MFDETTTTPIAADTLLNSSTAHAEDATTAPVTFRHVTPVDMSTSTGESLLGPSNVPPVTAILPPLVLLVLIGSLLILNVVIYARRKLVKKRTLRQDAYYCIVGPPSLPARTINVSCKDSSTERLYWTIADLDVKEDTKNKPNGVNFAVENIIMVKNHTDTPNAIINLLPETESLSTGTNTNPSSDCVDSTKNSAYSSNIATVPEIGMEITSSSTTAKVNHSLPSDSHCPARNPAYGTNVAIAPEIGTEVNVAYGFSSGSEETPKQDTHHRHPLSSCTSQGALAVHDASILTKANPSYGINVSTAPEIATQRNLAYHDDRHQ